MVGFLALSILLWGHRLKVISVDSPVFLPVVVWVLTLPYCLVLSSVPLLACLVHPVSQVGIPEDGAGGWRWQW